MCPGVEDGDRHGGNEDAKPTAIFFRSIRIRAGEGSLEAAIWGVQADTTRPFLPTTLELRFQGHRALIAYSLEKFDWSRKCFAGEPVCRALGRKRPSGVTPKRADPSIGS
jgi:hypothetical protein